MLDPLRRTSAADIAGAIVLAVASITAPDTELNARVGVTNGAPVLVTQNVAGINEWTLYAFDATSNGAVNSPYVVAASGSGQWIAVAGKYGNGALALAKTLNVTGTTTLAGLDATSIGATTRGTGLFTTIGANSQITSTLATGTAPFVVASTTNVANLNASSLGGATFAAPGAIGSGTPSTGAFTTISASGVITSTLATGTAPFTVASTTVVANLNATFLSGKTHADPGPIGSGTPSTGAFTTLTSSGLTTVTNATDATDSATAALVITGGVAMAKNLWVGAAGAAGTAMYLNCADASGNFHKFMSANVLRWQFGRVGSSSDFQLSAYDSSGNLTDVPLQIANAAGGAFTVVRPLSLTGTTDSTSISTGILIVSGGIGVAKRLTLDGGTGKTIRITNSVANNSVAVTLGSTGPTGSTAGAPQGWMRIDIAGTDRYMPFW